MSAPFTSPEEVLLTARGNRVSWESLPARIRMAFEDWLGEPVVAAQTQGGGMSPGAATRILTASGRRVFLKAVGPTPNVRSPGFYRREAAILPLLPDSVSSPRLLWSYDEGEDGWVALVLEDIDGRQSALPWVPDEIDRVMVDCLVGLTDALTLAPITAEQLGRAGSWGVVTGDWWMKMAEQADHLDDWSRQHLDLLVTLEAGAEAAVAGNTLLHLDLRDDNLLLTPNRVMVIDWTHARIGAPWLDIVLMAPSVAMQCGPDPETLIARHPATHAADPADITAAITAIAGSLTCGGMRAPPPGLPALPAFMAAQATEARRWLQSRIDQM